jgi:hypothetical protein
MTSPITAAPATRSKGALVAFLAGSISLIAFCTGGIEQAIARPSPDKN